MKITQFRTDLAVEICKDLKKNKSHFSGIECTETTCGPFNIEKVEIKSKEGETLSGKRMGTYLTVNTGKIWMDTAELLKEKIFAFRDILAEFLPSLEKGASILVAGLGNENITADAIGPVAVKNLVVTRHIRRERPFIFESIGLGDICAMTPGVLGQTGIESADIVESVVKKIKPCALIVIDALASRSLKRLVSTIQLSNSGIKPGSGVGNERPGLLPEKLGIPVISIGIPTVVDAATLAADAIDYFCKTKMDSESIRENWKENGLNFFVTPKETDQIIKVMGSFIGYGLNLALNPDLSYEDMLSLVGG